MLWPGYMVYCLKVGLPLQVQKSTRNTCFTCNNLLATIFLIYKIYTSDIWFKPWSCCQRFKYMNIFKCLMLNEWMWKVERPHYSNHFQLCIAHKLSPIHSLILCGVHSDRKCFWSESPFINLLAKRCSMCPFGDS